MCTYIYVRELGPIIDIKFHYILDIYLVEKELVSLEKNSIDLNPKTWELSVYMLKNILQIII